MYIRWGHDKCPSTAQLVYSGRAEGSHYKHSGGGSNPQCLSLDHDFHKAISGTQYRALTVMFMDIITLKYHVQFVMSVIILQSTWFLLSTHALQGGSESIMDT